MVKFENIEIKYGDFVAIENLNLDIKEGEFFTFLGPSGCGKTTSLRALVGFLSPSKGKETRTLQIFRLKKETLAWCSKAMRFSRQCQSMTTLRLE